MDTNAMLSSLQKLPGGSFADRIKVELQYALRLSQCMDNAYDDLIRTAAAQLLQSGRACGCITNAAAQACEQMLLPMEQAAKSFAVHCVSHAHIDMNWMWGFHETVAITLDTFRTVLKLMEEYPEFVFSQSQASTYRIVEEYDPALFARIQKRVAEGRWEVTASTWVEADKNLIDSESMARQILYAKKYFKEKFGISGDSLLLDFEPDTFGHSAMVPEILSHGGVRYYYHCRGNEPDHGRDIYYWDAPSGARILVYREPDWYLGSITPDFLENIPLLCKRNGVRTMMKVYGIGDHGGGPTRRDLEMILEMASWPIAPTLKFSTYGEYFRQLEKEADEAQFPVEKSELNYVFTGCYSSQSRIKAANRQAERGLYAAEAATVIAGQFLGGEAYDYSAAWENTLFNQFHDILPGSGVGATREYALGLTQQTLGYVYGGRSRSLLRLSEGINTAAFIDEQDKYETSEGAGVGFCGVPDQNSSVVRFGEPQMPSRGSGNVRIYHVFNPTQYARQEILEITLWDYLENDGFCLECHDAAGKQVPIELTETGNYWAHSWQKVLMEVCVPAFGYATYVFHKRGDILPVRPLCTDPRLEVYPANILENQFLRAEFDDSMQLVRLTDKQNAADLITQPSGYFTLTMQNHRGATVFPGNSWVEGFTVQEHNLNLEGSVFVTQKPAGTLRQSIRGSISYGKSILKLEVALAKDAKVLEYKLECDWHEDFDPARGIPALRFRLPLSKMVEKYFYQVPFGFLLRESRHHDVPAIGCGFAQLSRENANGIALLADTCYAYRGEENMLGLTMIRSSHDPDRYPEKGLHTFRLGVALCPPDMDQLANLHSAFDNTLYAWSDRAHTGTLPLATSLLDVEGSATVCALKQPEDGGGGFILRLFDHSGTGGKVRIRLGHPVCSVEQTDIHEQPVRRLTVENNSVELELAANEVATLKIRG